MKFVEDKTNPRDFRTLSIPQSDNSSQLPSRGWITLSELEAGVGGGAGKSCCCCQVGGSKMC